MDFTLSNLQARQAQAPKNDVVDVFKYIWRGGMPQIAHADKEERQEYYHAYVNTYLMRDVVEIGGVTNVLRFGKFLTACAALVARQINYTTLAEIAEISQPTAKEWLRLLESLGIIYLLQPYARNTLKRLTKAPKLYFCDSGLCAHLSLWLTPETLMNGAASGHFFENHVIVEIFKTQAYSTTKMPMTYYRDANAQEIDILIEKDQLIHPFEIKKSAKPDTREIKKFNVLKKADTQIGCGGIICMCEEVVPIDEQNCFIPCTVL